MYEKFYGLTERPFSLLPDPEYLYLSPKHLRALTLLEYGMMNQAGFSVICGDTGAGKTTLIRRLLTELGEDTTVGLITNTHKSFGELLTWVLMAFGIDSENKNKAQMHHLLIEFLIDQYAQNRRTVLIVDEAQNMTADTLEELRMLSNINADKDQVLQVILAGQPGLRETLRKPELMQFAQRIAVDYYLESLNRDETHEYIQHRLEVAGGDPETFTEEACHAIFRYSGGTPRLINLLCDTALVYGFAEQTRVIDAPLIEDVVREQHKNSIVPTFNKPETEAPAVEQKKPERRAKPAAASIDVQATAPVAEAPAPQVISEPLVAEQVQVASRSQKAAAHYEPAMSVGHADIQSNNEAAAQDEESAASGNNVTRIKKSTATKTRAADTAESISDTVKPQASAATQADSKPAAAGPKPSHAETERPSAYKDVYPIVHIADEPRKNVNVLVLGFAGGMVLASVFMFVAAWMMFRNDAPAPAVVSPPAATAPAISAEEQARMEAMTRERDEAIAATEALKRERDAAMMAAQKQEAMRTAEKRANEIIAAQEQKYSQEMELIRQRALDAEIAASRARERERIANEAADRARYEASRPVVTAAPQQPVTATTPQAEAEPKPVAASTKTKAPAPAESNSQFSANPCNSPSAKFLSTCKK